MSPPLTQVPAHPRFGAQRTTPVVRGKQRGTITHMSGGAWVVTLDEPEDFSDPRGESCVSMSAGDSGSPADAGWCIDLESEAGRWHAIRGLALHVGPSWVAQWGALTLEFGVCRTFPEASLMVQHARIGRWDRSGPISGLDTNDPTLLPDGSRWVDAEALARVLLHVLGGAS